MRVLDLFSGIGGFSLGLERAGMETVAFCEIDPFCRKVLRKHWPDVPIYDDICELTRGQLDAEGIGTIDVICGGFPCQDISSAGKKVGISGARSGLWSEMLRLVCEVRPRYVFVENVSALLVRGMGDVLGDLAAIRYDAEWYCIPASALGAPHGRDRVWIIGYPHNEGKSVERVNDETQGVPKSGENEVTHAKCREQQVGRLMEGIGRHGESVARDGFWSIENSPLGMGVDDGLPNRMDRLRTLGNAVVPQVVEVIGRAIMECES